MLGVYAVKQRYKANKDKQEQLNSTINFRKKFSFGVHTQEVTDSSSVVSTRRNPLNRNGLRDFCFAVRCRFGSFIFLRLFRFSAIYRIGCLYYISLKPSLRNLIKRPGAFIFDSAAQILGVPFVTESINIDALSYSSSSTCSRVGIALMAPFLVVTR